MNEHSYPFTLSRREFCYEFVSVSAEKEVKKVVKLSQTNLPNVYNLALFDELDTGKLCDMAESNNNDLKTILATVIKIIEDFLDRSPKCFVAFRGSDQRRQRLYRIVIARELSEIIENFEVFGGIETQIFLFKPNVDYEFYLISKHEN
ncbi:MAG: hypothetical protein ABIN80_03045 [Dyadobacter sp.]|uniref:DUF6934 family protein n=1 Tax=Dyadobacter sp. TaxID=1914288 RepID=UPI003267E923